MAESRGIDVEATECPSELIVRVMNDDVRTVVLDYQQTLQLPIDSSIRQVFHSAGIPESIPFDHKCVCLFQVPMMVSSNRRNRGNGTCCCLFCTCLSVLKKGPLISEWPISVIWTGG